MCVSIFCLKVLSFVLLLNYIEKIKEMETYLKKELMKLSLKVKVKKEVFAPWDNNSVVGGCHF